MQTKHKTKQITVNHIRISYIEAGPSDAPVILFLHGFPFDKSMWSEQLSFLQKDFRIIAMDIRGHGESDLGSEDFSIDLFAYDLIEFMNALALEEIVLCGHSMGGYVTLNAIHRFPKRFKGLVLAGTSCIADSPEVKQKRHDTIKFIQKEGQEKYADDILPKLFSKSSMLGLPNEIELIKNLILNTSVESITSTLKALANREEICGNLSQIDIPVLIIVGNEDILTPPVLSEQLLKGIQGSKLKVFQEAGHLTNLEKAIEFNHEVYDFLNLVSSSSL
ncbi:MAG: alpha/beta fold hydrolase [Saprospiraceae bacterium]|nr:alpha/beta fold hydrolase [Saprospiraceae bacterium]